MAAPCPVATAPCIICNAGRRVARCCRTTCGMGAAPTLNHSNMHSGLAAGVPAAAGQPVYKDAPRRVWIWEQHTANLWPVAGFPAAAGRPADGGCACRCRHNRCLRLLAVRRCCRPWAGVAEPCCARLLLGARRPFQLSQRRQCPHGALPPMAAAAGPCPSSPAPGFLPHSSWI